MFATQSGTTRFPESGAAMFKTLSLAFAAALPVVVHATPLTFDAALDRARHEAPSLKAKALTLNAAHSARGAAGALPDPKLTVGIDSFPISGPLAFEPGRDDFTWARVGVSQDIPNLAKRHAEQARADSDIMAAGSEQAVETRKVEVATATAWINLAFAERRLATIDEIVGRLDKVARSARQSVAAGAARPGQTLAALEAVARLEDRRSDLASTVARAKAELVRWTGDPDPEASGPIPDFAVDPSALKSALDKHPAIRVADARERQAEADLGVAQSGRRSDFGVDLSYQRRDPRFGDYVSAGVTIGLPIFTRRRQNAEIASKQSEAARSQAEREDARRALADALSSDLADHVMHHEQWLRARDTLQPLAEQRVALETASYAAGRASLADVADAHAALADATLTTLDREALVAADGARLVLTYRSDAQ